LLWYFANSKPLEALVVLASHYTVKETLDRLVILFQQRDIVIYARINRQLEAEWYGLAMRPLELILFDDPQLSGPMIEGDPRLALYFPLRIVAWEEAGGQCRVAFNDPVVLMRMYVPEREGPYWPDLQPDITRALAE
jgi:uncharacterized protein (DUF302 family)